MTFPPIAGALFDLLRLFAIMAVLLFLPARTLAFWQAWVFLAAFFVCACAVTLYLMRYDPGLYERRKRGGPGAETEFSQKIIMALASAGFAALLVVPALDHRFHWSAVPAALCLLGDVGVGLGYLAIFWVFRVNSFAAATVALHPKQTVISTGPYAIVRHPMYAGGGVLLAALPVALGSWWGLLVLVLLVPVLAWRLLDEEKFLALNLPGYQAYCLSVRYRLLPYVW
jgi:protein-S-isoprenylcysteine O-methyltransferase Ste14